MNISVISERGIMSELISRLSTARLITEPTGSERAIILDSSATPIESNGTILVNGNAYIRSIQTHEDVSESTKQILGIPEPTPDGSNPTVSLLFGVTNGVEMSEMLEIGYGKRLMNGEIGPDVGFSHGVGIRCNGNLSKKFPMYDKLVEFLAEMEYRGEVLIALGEDAQIVDISFGHHPHQFAMFAEAAKIDVDEIMGFCIGDRATCQLHSTMILANLVSKTPFPAVQVSEDGGIECSKTCDPCVWRIWGPDSLVAVVCVHADYPADDDTANQLGQARKRCFGLLGAMRSLEDSLQYRTDAGARLRFVLSQDVYEAMTARG